MIDYDVFITCKSEDYIYAEEIYDFLTAECVNVFLASKELRQMGESEYRKSIGKALKSAYHLIVFATKAEYVESKWVEFEWDMFLNAKLSGFKEGQILTILKDVDTHDLPMELWKYESFTFDSYKEKLLSYVETPAYLARKEEEKKRAQELAEARKEKENAEKAKKEAKNLLVQLAKDYSAKVLSLSTDVKEIEAKMRYVGITHRVCPVCKTRVDISERYCPSCGWTISPIEGIEGAECFISNDANQIDLIRNRSVDKSLVAKKDEEIKQLQAEITSVRESLTNKIKKYKSKYEELLASSEKERTPIDSTDEEMRKYLIDRYHLQAVLNITNVNDVYYFIKKFCTIDLHDSSCSNAGLAKQNLILALKVFYDIDLEDFSDKSSIWAVARVIWLHHADQFRKVVTKKQEIYKMVTNHCHSKYISPTFMIKVVNLDRKTLSAELDRTYHRSLPNCGDSETISHLVDKILDIL